ncbi:MAG: hypothetical protein H7Y05_08625 [Steroidobacteraceae bacterium]|nr:hypothetical protein [Deltaproteobacteria bacterium]
MAWNLIVNKVKTERERFAGPLVISGLVGAGLLLLVVLYPEKSLLKLLGNQEVSSPAQRRYLESLLRLRSGDNDLVLVLARSYLASKAPLQALETLDQLREPLTAEARKTSRSMRYEALRQRLLSLPTGSSEWNRNRQLFAGQIELMLQEGATRTETEAYRADAGRVGDSVTARRLQTLLTPPPTPAPLPAASKPATPASSASAAIARRDYRGAAAIYFADMRKSRDMRQRRQLFLSGVRTLQSGNLMAEALAAGESYINGLADDRETLLFMSRLALTANRPDRSQFYIRRALGMSAANGGAS